MRSPPPFSISAATQPSSSSSSQTFWHWNSPLPYLFVGLGLMVLLITAALVILACSFRKTRVPAHHGDKAAPPLAAPSVSDNTPKIVVIMAGEENPTHLAIPIPNSSLPPASSSDQTCVCTINSDD